MADEKPKCCKQIVKYGGGWRPSYHPCKNAGVVERDGQLYCRQHDPVARREKQDKRDTARNQKWDAERAQAERQRAALVACDGVPTEQLRPGIVARMIKVLRNFRAAGCVTPNETVASCPLRKILADLEGKRDDS